jgi:hypothetical protein
MCVDVLLFLCSLLHAVCIVVCKLDLYDKGRALPRVIENLCSSVFCYFI